VYIVSEEAYSVIHITRRKTIGFISENLGTVNKFVLLLEIGMGVGNI